MSIISFLLRFISLSYELSLEYLHLSVDSSGRCSFSLLLIEALDAIFGALLFLQCLFSLHMFVFMLPWIFSLRNFSLWQFRVQNVGLRKVNQANNGNF
ncbi:hypothetical protein Aazo_1733 ['Nostoc azollae' 0708]|jgi:hypothetical protein|uniref:Uncharacterized protein n=1 Tax=Nostoc azollae (strain 0708) TaxID=551115 RepID=D7E578_NOSA0|nr:hypothetical protein Aazo_1733 ['Nostoc azollae' 0708]